ncbi:anthocyanidin 3-o-glucosyltransferase 2 [Phtheirospermum japonicum]|uniref:Anthocyanidin 3-o-glucosyltransferase 2 n=1 Tax=Phtheirospermum japonicum TaxID=374723 RepID=A0A830CV50_9LAMI|nr:anthocyanidin 3-o-glucosyltransferase 2 [Phtheirospermum japonicum]
MIDVANEFGVPTYLFFTSGAAMLGLLLHLQGLLDYQNQDLTLYGDTNDELSIPSYESPISPKLLPSFLFDKDSNQMFIDLARMSRRTKIQVKEIAMALEKSGHHFLWSLRKPPGENRLETPGEYENPSEILPEGFIQRTSSTGKVIGWAPQVAVLSHCAVGGFVSHCGWNSTLESIWCGVPMEVWPLYAEQSANAFQLE